MLSICCLFVTIIEHTEIGPDFTHKFETKDSYQNWKADLLVWQFGGSWNTVAPVY